MRIIALDLIRFIAALAVVLYHYISRPDNEAFESLSVITQFGYLGVPLFFIISGYVIALSATNRSAMEFAVSRFVRLYPAYWAGIAFTVMVSSLLSDHHYSLRQILANATMLNEYLGFADIDGVYWTLKAELKFYACVFLLLLCGLFEKFRVWLSLWTILTAVHVLSGQPFFMGWFISPGYSSFFIAGIACFLIQREGPQPFNLTILAASLIVSSLRAYQQTGGFIPAADAAEKWVSVVIIWGFYALFFTLATREIGLKSRRIYAVLGALTYPLYLIHNVAGKAILDFFAGTMPAELLMTLVIATMILASWLIHVGIEQRLSSPLKHWLLASSARLALGSRTKATVKAQVSK